MTEQKNNPENKKSPTKGPNPPRFNFYWIYGIIMVGLIIMTFLPKQEGSSTTLREVLEMVERNDVDKIVVNNDRFIEVYLTDEALENEKYKDVKAPKGLLGSKIPHYKFESNFEYFVAELDKLPEEARSNLHIEQTHTEDYSGWFSWLIMIALFIFFWMFVMRRMIDITV